MAQAPDLTLFARIGDLARAKAKTTADQDAPGLLSLSEIGRPGWAERLPPCQVEAEPIPGWTLERLLREFAGPKEAGPPLGLEDKPPMPEPRTGWRDYSAPKPPEGLLDQVGRHMGYFRDGAQHTFSNESMDEARQRVQAREDAKRYENIPEASPYPPPTKAPPPSGWTLEKILRELAGPKEAY